MRVLNQLSYAVVALLAMTTAAHAATVEVNWQDVENYRDIRASNELQERFQNRVTNGLTAHLQQLGESLPADHVLRITVTDVDLAGRIEPIFTDTFNSMRVVNRIDYPMIELSFEYVDGSGSVLKSGSETIKDMAQLETRRTMQASGQDSLYHEKRLLDKWFRANFSS